MKKIYSRAAITTAFFIAPVIAVAQKGINTTAITSYSNGILYVINYILVPVLIGIAFIVFLWGVFKYFIYGAAEEAERAKGKQFVLWGVIGFVVILSLWGIVNIVMGAFGLSVGKAPPPPTFNPSTPTSQTTNATTITNTGQTGTPQYQLISGGSCTSAGPKCTLKTADDGTCTTNLNGGGFVCLPN